MSASENWHQRLLRIIAFGFIDWANSPRMLQMEILKPWRYRLLTWPPAALLVGLYGVFVVWLSGVIRL